MPRVIENLVDLLRSSTSRCLPDGKVVDTLRSSTATRWMSARQLRAGTRSMLAKRRSTRRAAAQAFHQAMRRHRAAIITSLRQRGSEVELWSAGGGNADQGEEQLRRQVLRAIQTNPDGVAAIDIANQLGVDWRRVDQAAQTLVMEGTIEQVERDLYPARKASGT